MFYTSQDFIWLDSKLVKEGFFFFKVGGDIDSRVGGHGMRVNSKDMKGMQLELFIPHDIDPVEGRKFQGGVKGSCKGSIDMFRSFMLFCDK